MESDVTITLDNIKVLNEISIDTKGNQLSLTGTYKYSGKEIIIEDSINSSSIIDLSNLKIELESTPTESTFIKLFEIRKDYKLIKGILGSKIQEPNTAPPDSTIIEQVSDDGKSVVFLYHYVNEESKKEENQEYIKNLFNGGEDDFREINSNVVVDLGTYTLNKDIRILLGTNGNLTLKGNVYFKDGNISIEVKKNGQVNLSGLTLTGKEEKHSPDLIFLRHSTSLNFSISSSNLPKGYTHLVPQSNRYVIQINNQ